MKTLCKFMLLWIAYDIAIAKTSGNIYELRQLIEDERNWEFKLWKLENKLCS